MANILIIDDEAQIRRSLKDILEYEGHQINEAEDGKKGWMKLKTGEYDLCFCDIKMPGMDGHDVQDFAANEGVDTPLIMISGHANIENAVDSIKKGAYDFIEKPLDLNRILVSTRNALDKKELITETKVLKQKVARKAPSLMVGESQALQELDSMIDKVAPTEARVLITGPNGSGKELVARQIHLKSSRAKKAFVEVNCAAIPGELIESELFGHEKGAFTSAVKQKKGKFEIASEGTLFLDEIGDMSLNAQAKVLRALQEHKITRVGGEKDIKVHCRVIAATNKNLKKAIAENKFREDLYHRLCVIHLQVPSLKDRLEDIPLLAEHFLRLICEDYGMPKKSISEGAITKLQEGAWTGNVREFRNAIERLIILSGDEIDEDAVNQYL